MTGDNPELSQGETAHETAPGAFDPGGNLNIAAEAETLAVQRRHRERPLTPAEAAIALGAALGAEQDRFSRSRPLEREHENENRLDRGWQKLGDVALRVVKASVVTGAIRGYIPRPVASRIVGSKTLKGA